jgi:hypothetical protein
MSSNSHHLSFVDWGDSHSFDRQAETLRALRIVLGSSADDTRVDRFDTAAESGAVIKFPQTSRLITSQEWQHSTDEDPIDLSTASIAVYIPNTPHHPPQGWMAYRRHSRSEIIFLQNVNTEWGESIHGISGQRGKVMSARAYRPASMLAGSFDFQVYGASFPDANPFRVTAADARGTSRRTKTVRSLRQAEGVEDGV